MEGLENRGQLNGSRNPRILPFLYHVSKVESIDQIPMSKVLILALGPHVDCRLSPIGIGIGMYADASSSPARPVLVSDATGDTIDLHSDQ